MKAAITDFLLICITLKTVKWIELLKDWLYQLYQNMAATDQCIFAVGGA